MIEKFSSGTEFNIGVVSDTHIPDRTRTLNASLLPALEQHKVNLILHAGDICIPRVLEEMESVAPVLAVKGNRDIIFGNDLPLSRTLEVNGVKILLCHGHMGLISYWLDKFQHMLLGYRSDRYMRRLKKEMGEADIYVFGHSHRSEVIRQDQKLFFNPGSVSIGAPPAFIRSWGLLTFNEEGVTPKIISLESAVK